MSLVIPGSRGCFSFFQEAPKTGAQWIKITTPVRNQLQYFLWLARDVSSRPTHLEEVVTTPLTYYESVDATIADIGGIWFPLGRSSQWPCTDTHPTVSIIQLYGGPHLLSAYATNSFLMINLKVPSSIVIWIFPAPSVM